MSYLYGDSTPSTLEVNFIEFLRDAVEFSVQLLLADQRIVQGRAHTRALDHETAAEVERLQKLSAQVAKAFDGMPLGAADSAAARCTAAILRSASELVRAETAQIRSGLEAEISKRDAQAAREREGCLKALEVLLAKHDLPGMSMELLVALKGAHYGCRTRFTTGFGLDATLDLEIPANHLYDRVVRVDRLSERLDVQAPEIGGWLNKGVKLKPQHLEKHHVTELSIGAAGDTLKLRLGADGTGPGFDVVFAKGAPRVRMLRVDQGEGRPADEPFDLEDDDARKMIVLHDRLVKAAVELTRHRRSVVQARLDGEPLQTHAKPTLLIERLVATIAPTVQEIAARSQSPGELVLRRLLGDARREEIFLSKAELKHRIEPLAEANRALFDPLWATPSPAALAATAKPATATAPPATAAPAPAAEPPRTEPPRQRPTPARGTAPVSMPVTPARGTPGPPSITAAGSITVPPALEVSRAQSVRPRPATPAIGSPAVAAAAAAAPSAAESSLADAFRRTLLGTPAQAVASERSKEAAPAPPTHSSETPAK